jgi:hypothetical protein
MSLWPPDPIAITQHIGRGVIVKLTCGRTQQGWLYTVDPENHSVAIVTGDDQSTDLSVCVILGANVAGLELGNKDSACRVDLKDKEVSDYLSASCLVITLGF